MRWAKDYGISDALYLCRTCHRRTEALNKTRIKLETLEKELKNNKSQKNVFQKYATDIESTPKQSSLEEHVVFSPTRSPAKKRIKLQLFQDHEKAFVANEESICKSKVRLIANKISQSVKVKIYTLAIISIA